MKTLSRAQYEQAKQFLCTEARELEHVLFRYEFEAGDEQQVLSALAFYQNDDGGFGKGLEPDLRCQHSSALATTVALQTLSQLASPNKEAIIERCLQYFVNSYIQEINGWEIIPVEADQAPRAIWWNYSPKTDTWGNPNVEIIAYLYQYSHLLSEQWQEKAAALLEDAVQYLQTDCTCNEMHELFCYIRLYDVLDSGHQQNISREMNRFLENCVVNPYEQRNGYCAVPLQVVTSPASSFYSKYEDVIAQDLDRLIDEQNEQGAWEPNWSWGRYEEQWEAAKKEWAGYITLNNLRILKAFDRIGQV